VFFFFFLEVLTLNMHNLTELLPLIQKTEEMSKKRGRLCPEKNEK